MKIEVGEQGAFVFSEVYNGIGIKTDKGYFGIAERDGGIEVLFEGELVWSSSELGGEEQEGDGPLVQVGVPTLSTGDPSTLGTYRRLVAAMVGEGSKAVKYFDAKIAEQGEDEPVLADERQMLQLIGSML